MKHSTERILTTHAGNRPLPPGLGGARGGRAGRGPETVVEVVKKQIACGLDVINDGEVGKPNFSRYARERLSGFVERPAKPDERASTIFGRDLKDFPEDFQKRLFPMRGEEPWRGFCNRPPQ